MMTPGELAQLVEQTHQMSRDTFQNINRLRRTVDELRTERAVALELLATAHAALKKARRALP
jgi:hypothetical protein